MSSLKTQEGEDDIVAWLGRLLYENDEVNYFENKPGIPFIKIDTVKQLYEVCNIKVMSNLDIQGFFDLL